MGDRCYMEVTCRRQDQERFVALGFTAQDWNEPSNPALVVMVDEEANYAHSGDMPTDIPYHGFNGGGGNFGDGALACDGKVYAEVETGHEGGFVVDWDEAKNRPSLTSLKSIRQYIRVRHQVQQLFDHHPAQSTATRD